MTRSCPLRSISALEVTTISAALGGGALGEALEDGLGECEVLELGDTDALAEDDTEGLTLALGDSDGLILIDGEGEADTELEGLKLGDTEGDTDADGDAEGEPISATTISAQTFTPFVAPRRE